MVNGIINQLEISYYFTATWQPQRGSKETLTFKYRQKIQVLNSQFYGKNKIRKHKRPPSHQMHSRHNEMEAKEDMENAD